MSPLLTATIIPHIAPHDVTGNLSSNQAAVETIEQTVRCFDHEVFVSYSTYIHDCLTSIQPHPAP